MNQLPPLKAIRAFEATARHESVTRAALELCVSHSAISQQIKVLESYFNQKLFRKKGNGIELTPKARTYLQDVTQSLALLATASDNLSNKGAVNHIRVNSTPSFAQRCLIPRIAEFQSEYPDIEVQIETSNTDEMSNISDHNDLIIRRYPMKKNGMICQRLMDDESIAVVSPQLVKDQNFIESDDLLNCKLLHVKSRISAWPSWFRKAGVKSNETLSGPVFDHFFLGLEAAICGSGVALVPKEFVVQDLDAGRLLNVSPDICIVGAGYYCLYNGDSCNTDIIRKLVSWISVHNQLEEADHWDVEWTANPG